MRRYIFRAFITALVLIILGLLYWGWSYVRRSSSFPIQHFHVSSSVQYIDAQHIQQVAKQHLNGGFFSLNIDQLKRALLRLPWIEDISFRRKWPDTLDITVKAKHPEARWGLNGVISSRGDIFYPAPKSIPKGLSRINGPVENKDKILDNYQKLSDDLRLLSLRITDLRVSAGKAYQVILSNGITVMVGQEDVVFRFARFVDLYPKIIGNKSQDVVSVDLRYSNGIAIKWKK